MLMMPRALSTSSSEEKEHKRPCRAGKILCFLLTAVLTAGSIYAAARVLRKTDSEYQYDPFFEDDTQYDVLFFGNSHAQYGISPLQLYRDYGITSYNLASHGMSIAASYWLMKNAIEYHKPKMAVLDIYMVDSAGVSMKRGLAHAAFDRFPLTRTKAEGIRDIFEGFGEQLEFYVPFSVFHNNWPSFTMDSIKKIWTPAPRNKNKGQKYESDVVPAYYHPVLDVSEVEEGDSKGKEYVRRFIELCREEDIEPVLILVPYPADEERQRWQNSVYTLAEEESVSFIDLYHMDLVDQETDFYDPDSHLNLAGSCKVTDALGRELTGRFDLTDHRSEEEYSSWKEDLKAWNTHLRKDLVTETRLANILVFLSWPEFTAEIGIDPGCVVPPYIEKLIQQSGSRIREYETDENELSLYHEIHVKVTEKGSGDVLLEGDFADQGKGFVLLEIEGRI